MLNRSMRINAASLLLLVGLSAATRAADVLQNVPHDALGFVVIKRVGLTDAKIDQLWKTLHVKLPGPLAFLKSATGVSAGLNPQGDFLLAVLPGEEAAQRKPQFYVWLPVTDFDRFIASLDATPGQGIVAVTVAGENLLAARHGEWALVMDTDQRARVEQMLAAGPNPPASAAAWQNWIDASDVTAVALPSGIRAILAAASPAEPAGQQPASVEQEDDIFGKTLEDEDAFAALTIDGEATGGIDSVFRAVVRNWIRQSPKLAEWLPDSKAIGCTFRLDDRGNALAGVRVSCSDNQLPPATSDRKTPSPPALYEGGTFVLNGAGAVPSALTVAAAGMFVRWTADDLKNQQRLVLDDRAITRFRQALEQAAADVASALVLTQPGDNSEGIYTNDFLVVRTASARAFVDRASEVMRLWNTMNRDAEGDSRLVFDVEEQKFGDRAATRYSLDIAAAEGAADLPEIRQAMEKFFGPGGKMRLWIVPVDDATVLLAAATRDEVAAALKVLDRKQPIDWNRTDLASSNSLLPEQADWRVFVSPHAYDNWHRRLMEAMTGPVLGGRPLKEFPVSPPVGLAGGFRDHELWLDAAVPAATIQSAGAVRK